MKPGLIACYLLFCFQSFAQWNPDPKVACVVSDMPGVKILQRTVKDGAGGMIVAFVNDLVDCDNGCITYRTYNVQRVTAAGKLSWGTASSPIHFDSIAGYFSSGSLPDAGNILISLEPDGNGGVFIAWAEQYLPVKVQHIDASGQLLWGSSGKAISSLPANSTPGFILSLVASNAGLIVGWNNAPNIFSTDQTQLYAQRIDNMGNLMWGPNGIQVVDLPGIRYGVLVSDGVGGATAYFTDNRNVGIGLGNDVYGQRLDSNGIKQWTAAGKQICSRFGNQEVGNAADFKMNKNLAFADDSGNAFIMFSDDRNVSNNDQLYSPNWDIYGQKISRSGDILWDTSAVHITSEIGPQQPDNILPDHKGGVVALFTSQRNYYIIQYIQRLNSNGIRVFSDSGILVSPTPTQNADNYSAISVSDSGNIYVNSYSYKGSLYNQKYNALGMPQWDTAATKFNIAAYPITTIISNSDESSIISWIAGYILKAFKLTGNGLPFIDYTSIANGHWNNPATWASGVVPNADSHVVINAIITITADTECYSLEVGPGGQVIVAPGVHFTVLH